VLVSLSAADFLRYISWAVFFFIGLWVLARAARRPTRVNVDAALLFGGLAAAILCTALVQLGVLAASRPVTALITAALLAAPFLLVRLMDGVVGVPPPLMRVFMGAMALYIGLAWLAPPALLAALAAPLVLGLLATLIYVAAIGLRGVRHARGITRRRLIAVSLGSLLLAGNFGASRLPIAAADARSLVDLFGVAAGLSYYLGFAPPRWLRRVWQGPEVWSFLARSASLPQIEDGPTMLRALEQGAAAALGAPHATIGLWDEAAGLLRFTTAAAPLDLRADSELPAARAFRLQQAVFSRNTHYDAELESRYRLSAVARAVLAAPISASGQRLGVIAVYSPQVALFADDDLALLQLLADQAAVVIESRRLGERLARVRAREEGARLKEDFLSTAAHDLKTPLTALLVHSQAVERRAARSPELPADRGALRRIVAEAERLRATVLELLDAARAEQVRLVGARRQTDLAALVREVAGRYEDERHPFSVEAPGQLELLCDGLRIAQLLEHLVENAVKYSPAGGPVALRLWQDGDAVHLSVADRGIGVPADDMASLFERFHRGANVDDRRFPGWGLGLSICRRIVEQHGGQISVSSRENNGTTFHITLPAAPAAQAVYVAAHPRR
jgi:signal transduction histidine kinase